MDIFSPHVSMSWLAWQLDRLTPTVILRRRGKEMHNLWTCDQVEWEAARVKSFFLQSVKTCGI